MPALSTTLAVQVDCRPKHLNTLNTMVALTLRKHIPTPDKMVSANLHLKTSLFESLTLLISLW